MRPLQGIWIDSLTTLSSVIEQIEISLTILKENAENGDFSDKNARKYYADQVSYMKQFFERAEYLARRGIK